MKKSYRSLVSNPAFLLSSAVVAATVSLLAPGLSSTVKAAWQDSPKVVLDQAWQIVNNKYVDPTFNKQNWQQVRTELLSRDYGDRTQAYDALRKALSLLQDPYTRFMDPKQYADLTDQTSGSLSGVGMRLKLDEKLKAVVVVEPIRNSPAMKAGVKAGDRILAIDGRSAEGMTVETAAELIRGEAGKTVRVKFSRDNQAFELVMTRARVEVPSVEHALKQEGALRVGYIRLNSFTAHSPEEMAAAIKDLNSEGADAFLFDQRGNPGGSLKACIEISQMWLNSGKIVKTVDRDSVNEVYEANRSALTDLPLVVLVDKGSASSSEIFAGAVKDNKRATLVGTKTFGKALVQVLQPLSDNSGLAVTIAHYYTPNGTDISKKGVDPDVEVTLTEAKQKELGQSPDKIATMADPQYARGVEILRDKLKTKPQPAAPAKGKPLVTPAQPR
jgi:carboxyl-terminal processing protease